MQAQISPEDQYLRTSVNVRLRKEPSTECEVLTVMKQGTSKRIGIKCFMRGSKDLCKFNKICTYLS